MKGAHRRALARTHGIVAIGTTILLATSSLTACGQDAANALNRLLAMKPPYPDKSWSLIYSIHKMRPPDDIYWLDNERILFPGYEKDSDSLPFVFILDTTTGKYTKEASLREHYWFCFNRVTHFLAYDIAAAEPGVSPAMMAGPIGAETFLPELEKGKSHPELKQCWPWPNDELRPDRPNANVRNLSPEDGYILVVDHPDGDPSLKDRQEQDGPVQWIKPGKAPVNLPIQRKELENHKLTYSDYAGAYLLIPESPRSGDAHYKTNWPKDEGIPIYSISHSGEVKVIEIPAGSPEPAGVYLTRRGLLWVSNEMTGNSRSAGAWLLVDGKPQKIIEHFVTGVGVSPDGCKIAYSVNSVDPQKTDNLHLMSVCETSPNDQSH